MRKNQLRWVSILTIVLTVILNVVLVCYAQVPSSVDEIDRLEQESIQQLENELQAARNDLSMKKARELQIMESANMEQFEKQRQKIKIEQKYLKDEKKIESNYNSRRRKMISYYSQMKKELIKAMPPPTTLPTKITPQKAFTFVPPQELIDNWSFISSFRYVGTLKFTNVKNVVTATIYFLRYNKWDEILNLTYDGYNIAFDYENPYGVNLHFEGTINQKATIIKGKFVDLKTKKIYTWKAFR